LIRHLFIEFFKAQNSGTIGEVDYFFVNFCIFLNAHVEENIKMFEVFLET
jgi:hypothetical protein